MDILFYILAVIATLITGFGALTFGAGALGHADPTDHGNIVAVQFGLLAFLCGLPFWASALAIHTFF
jgi:hypothetical protein